MAIYSTVIHPGSSKLAKFISFCDEKYVYIILFSKRLFHNKRDGDVTNAMQYYFMLFSVAKATNFFLFFDFYQKMWEEISD